MEYGTHQIDQELVLNDIAYQIDGTYTKVLDHEETDERGAVIFSDDDIIFNIEEVTHGEDFEITLTDHKILGELESELYNLD